MTVHHVNVAYIPVNVQRDAKTDLGDLNIREEAGETAAALPALMLTGPHAVRAAVCTN